MSKRSAAETLPPAVKAWLDRALVEGNFGGYETLAEELRARGCEISRSSLHRYGQEFERRLMALKLASEQARAVAEAVPDEENNLSDALTRLVQQKAFDMLVKMEGDPKVSFAALGRLAVDSAEVTTKLKRFRDEVRRRSREAADEVAREVKQAGLSNDTVERIRRQIMGIQA